MFETQLIDHYQKKFSGIIEKVDPIKVSGKVTDVIGMVIVSMGPNVSLGEVCIITDHSGHEVYRAEVVGFKEGKVLSVALGEVEKISQLCEIKALGQSPAKQGPGIRDQQGSTQEG